MRYKLLIFSMALCGLLAFAGAAQAASVGSLAKLGTENTISDDDAERFIDNDGDGVLSVGDDLRGILRMFSWEAPSGSTGQNIEAKTGKELTAIFQVRVHGLSFLSAGSDGVTNANPLHPDAADDVYVFSFAPSASFTEANDLFGAGSGAMVIFYEDDLNSGDGTEPFTLGTSIAVDEASASDGDVFFAIGMLGTMVDPGGGASDADGDEVTTLGEGWLAEGQLVPAQLVGVNQFNVGLNRIGTAGVNWGFGPVGTPFTSTAVQFIGSGEIQARSTGDHWDVDSEAEIRFIPVPLPAAAWAGMMMLGLVGAGRSIRRRRRNS